jgi:hypothetical protein
VVGGGGGGGGGSGGVRNSIFVSCITHVGRVYGETSLTT